MVLEILKINRKKGLIKGSASSARYFFHSFVICYFGNNVYVHHSSDNKDILVPSVNCSLNMIFFSYLIFWQFDICTFVERLSPSES